MQRSERSADRRWRRMAVALIAAVAVGVAGIGPAQAVTSTGTISGHVTDRATGTPLAGVTVTAVVDPGFDGSPRSAVTNASGDYVISGLEQGTYLVDFSAGAPYAEEFWPHVPVDRLARPIVSVAGSTKSGIDAVLQHPATLSGTVTRADTGEPAAGVAVLLEQRDVDQRDVWTKYAYTDADGRYSIPGILPGAYRVHLATGFFDGLIIASQYWPAVFHSADATLVTLAPDENRAGLDTAVMPQAHVTGIVTRADTGQPLGGAWVDAIDSEGVIVGYGSTSADGRYRVDGLPPGEFTVRVRPPKGSGTANDLAITTSDPVAIPLAGTATDDVTVGMGGHLRGIVDYVGGNADQTTITAYRWNGTAWAAEAVAYAGGFSFVHTPYDFTDGGGLTGALRPGKYIVRFESKGLCTKYWNGAFTAAKATGVMIAAHQSTSGISVVMTSTCTNPTITPGAVAVTGAPAVGSTVTATPRSWQPFPVSYTYRWYSVSGTTSTAIAGATGRTFAPTSAQAGRGLKVVVTGSMPGTTSCTRSSPVVGKVALASTPTISGTAAVGFRLTAHPRTWTTGTSFSYAWFANGVYISGTTGSTHSTFAPTSAQKGKQISVKVTGIKPGYATASSTSVHTVKVALTATPTITGTRRVGSTLTAHPGTWTAGTVFTYRWYANGSAIAGATRATFALTSAQRGKTIKAVVTGTDVGYQTISRVSASTAPIG